MPEAEVIQNQPFIYVGRYGHLRTEWTSQKGFIYPDSQTARFLIFLQKSWKNQLFYMKNSQYLFDIARVGIGKD